MKKSKFLKKSLAMLLALMLVVAMIPLSAAAAEAPSGVVWYITVNDATVDLQSSNPSIQVNDLNAPVRVKLAADLTGHYQLQAIAAPSVSTTETAEITVNGVTGYPTGLPANRYVTKTDDKTATISLQLVDTKDTPATSDDTKYDPYVITLNQVDARTTTNLSEDVVLGRGVYSAEVDNVNKVINVVLARHTGGGWDATSDAKWDEDGAQADLDAEIKVTPLEGATVDNVGDPDIKGAYTVEVDNNDTFTVTSESKGNHSTYKVVATYKDAIKSFSVDGVDGVISDEDKNDVPDTITVTLPKDAINDQWGYPVTDPEFAVDYEVEGNVHCTVSIYQTNDGNAIVSNLVGGEDVPFNGLSLTNDEWTGTVRVYRLGTGTNANNANDAIQVYNLKVQLEDSTDTDILYVRANTTIADVDLDNGTVHAVLPVNVNDENTPTDLENVDLVIYTPSTASNVVVDGAKAYEGSNANDQAVGRAVWAVDDVDLRTQKVITVYAEDGKTTRQYTITAEISGRHDDASITNFAIGDYDGVITKSGGANTPDVITVTVPYMTLDVEDLRVYATPSSGAKVQFTDLNGNTADLINGYHTAGDLQALYDTIPVDGALTGTIVAVDKNDETVRQEYVVNVVLDKPAATGNRLEGLHFTAQPVTNDSDRDIMHAIDEDENVFTANVWENTDSSNNVGTINLKIAPSLMDNREGYFNNVVTDFTTVDGGVAFAVINQDIDVENPTGDVRLALLDATDSDASDSVITGTILDNDRSNATINGKPVDPDNWNGSWYNEVNTVVVLPEEIARQVLVGDAKVANKTNNDTNRISAEECVKQGTVYKVEIEEDLHSSEDDLISFTVGDTELIVNKNNNTISGVLPWSATNTTVVSSWELSKYAKAVVSHDTTPTGMEYFTEAGATTLYFQRVDDANHSVKVYIGTPNGDTNTLGLFEIQAEDRLTVGDNEQVPSYTDWTFNLTWKDACDDADFESFSINGVNGVIDDSDPDNRTITVNLPFASDVTGLVAEFETSPEATVTLTTPDGVLVESGVTSINYTNTVLLYVHSESGENVNSYKVTVNLGSHFSDIDEDDWYYDNVMDAADNGYISGMGDGTFNPMGSTTRAQFASMIANAMGYEADPEAPSMFRDVADDFWGKAAINFCVQNGILTGYEDGSFQPNKAITRQEAASILRNAFELTETTSELFPDDSAIAGWAKESVYLVKASGLMKGDAGTGNFRPTSTITRAEAASILMNAKYAGVIN